MSEGDLIIEASRRFSRIAARFRPGAPVAHVYNPISYAWDPYSDYTRKFASAGITALFLGMNPGPWGMAQTGIPFGEISFVRDWMGVRGTVRQPSDIHPRVPVLGFDSRRSEVSGRRFWGLMRERFGTPRSFFKRHFAANYCPLLFLDRKGGNVTPDKLSRSDRDALFQICDDFLERLIHALNPGWVVGIGAFAQRRISEAAARFGWQGIRIGGIPHPSPANPGANRDWSGIVTRKLEEMGVWSNHQPLSGKP
jgi:single-strand selective monofunctional uracil DNA glycosylase